MTYEWVLIITMTGVGSGTSNGVAVHSVTVGFETERLCEAAILKLRNAAPGLSFRSTYTCVNRLRF